jgi:hypothetical protein
MEVVLEYIRSVVPGIAALGHIDNGIAVCTTLEQASAVCQALFHISDLFGLTLNDRDEIVPQQLCTFVGIELDFANGQFRLGTKSAAKIAVLREHLLSLASNARVPTRLISCMWGTLVHVHTLRRHHGKPLLCNFPDLFEYIRTLSRDAEARPEVWDLSTPLTQAIIDDLRAAFDIACDNQMLTPRLPSSRDEPIIFVDASAERWAGVLTTDGTTHEVVSGAHTVDAKHSTVSEPTGMINALSALDASGKLPTPLTIATDHYGLAFAFRKGFSVSKEYNNAIRWVSTKFGHRATLTTISGELNPADEPSRGMPLDAAKLQTAVTMLRERDVPAVFPSAAPPAVGLSTAQRTAGAHSLCRSVASLDK